jgi:NAD(P)-dependent dehydrogenase (short-subunit alcohol dehydrogenase family)
MGEAAWEKVAGSRCWSARVMPSALPLRGGLPAAATLFASADAIRPNLRRLSTSSGRKATTSTPSASTPVRKQKSRSYSRASSATSVRSRSAGSNVNKPLLETTEKLFFKAWELACYAGFLVGREAARVMLPRGCGTILFTGATASIRGSKGFVAFSSAKFGLRALAQAMARELGPKNIHVVHLIIDAGVDSEAIHQRMKAARGIEASEIPPDSLTKTSSIAEAYWFAHQQSRDGWTHELDLRPAVEKW